MKLHQATIENFNSIIAFYDDVIEHTPEIELNARWQKGKHPTAGGIKAYIEEGSLYLYREENVILGAMAVTMYQEEDYHAIEWSKQVADDEVAVIHILAVSPASNIPAHRMYERLGFEYSGRQHLYAENTGWTDFYFFEL